jgi:uncharacterized protein YndB with AHSA1/START domain
MSSSTTTLVVQKSVLVDAPPEEAFRAFTAGLSEWWPFETHSIGGERTHRAVFEEREGGRVYEVLETGEEEDWATVLAWEPPQRFVLSWHVNKTQPATEVEVRFAVEGDGTRVRLDHRGWERPGADAGGGRDGYDAGWEHVLGRYAAALAR